MTKQIRLLTLVLLTVAFSATLLAQAPQNEKVQASQGAFKNYIQVTWTAVGEGVRYRIFRQLISVPADKKTAKEVELTKPNAPIEVLFFQDNAKYPNLLSGRKYLYTVRSVKDNQLAETVGSAIGWLKVGVATSQKDSLSLQIIPPKESISTDTTHKD